MGNWFTKLFGAKKCCCHHGEGCCQEKKEADNTQSVDPENTPASVEQSPVEEVASDTDEKTE